MIDAMTMMTSRSLPAAVGTTNRTMREPSMHSSSLSVTMQRMKPLDRPLGPMGSQTEESQDHSSRRIDRVETGFLHRPAVPETSIAPIKRLAIPSARERKKAFLSAKYYGECAIRGINAIDADKAAAVVKDQYGKWWPHKRRKGGEKEKSMKRLKMCSSDQSGGTISDSSSTLPPVNPDHHDTDAESVTAVSVSAEQVHAAKISILQELKRNGGDTESSNFLRDLDILHSYYMAQGFDARWTQSDPFCPMDGIWLTLSRPTYSDCLGQNAEGHFLYTLGRLSFDFFRPTGLRCSMDGIFQQIGPDNGDETLGDSSRPRTFPTSLLRSRVGPAIRTNE